MLSFYIVSSSTMSQTETKTYINILYTGTKETGIRTNLSEPLQTCINVQHGKALFIEMKNFKFL